MTDLRTAAQQALEALERYQRMMMAEAGCQSEEGEAAIDNLRAALAEPVQEPVASIYITPNGAREFDDWRHDLPVGSNLLYTAPPQRKPLTEEEIAELARQEQFLLICDGLEELTEITRAIERAHGITP